MPRLATLFFAAALAGLAARDAAAGSGGSCEWRAPAHDPFQGDVPGAVDDYPDIPAATRARLKARMQRVAYDDIVAIRRDSIEGNFRYEPALLGMHFGKRRLCGQVTRQSWQPAHEERGLAYCEDGHCVVLPLVCRNVSRIIRKPPAVAVMGGPAGRGDEPIVFDPPSAGLPPGTATPADAGPAAFPLQAPVPAGSALPPGAEVPLAPAPVPVPPLPPAGEAPPPAPLPSTPAPPPTVPPGAAPPEVPPALPPQAPPPSFPAPPIAMPPLPPLPAVPEPATAMLWAVGLAAGEVGLRRRRAWR